MEMFIVLTNGSQLVAHNPGVYNEKKGSVSHILDTPNEINVVLFFYFLLILLFCNCVFLKAIYLTAYFKPQPSAQYCTLLCYVLY